MKKNNNIVGIIKDENKLKTYLIKCKKIIKRDLNRTPNYYDNKK